MGTIKFRMAARCEAAGRRENEDNYQLSDDLSKNNWGFTVDKEIQLGKQGALIVVCDGMGGMNAGEIASKLAVETVIQHFSIDDLSSVVSSSTSIKKYIEKVIIAADAAIKDEGRADPEKAGMGSTIVLAWFVGDKVYVGWCGDSRAYRYNPVDGLIRLSRDHSYVQELIDEGKLNEELAFDHPNNNIITRSLGDTSRTAKPDVREFPLQNGDIFMLWTDGLSGVLRDDEIKNVMEQKNETLTICRDTLWETARNANWNDNVTIGLCQILSGAKKAEAHSANVKNSGKQKSSKKMIITLIIIIILLLGIIMRIVNPKGIFSDRQQTASQCDSLPSNYEVEELWDMPLTDWPIPDSTELAQVVPQFQKDTSHSNRLKAPEQEAAIVYLDAETKWWDNRKIKEVSFIVNNTTLTATNIITRVNRHYGIELNALNDFVNKFPNNFKTNSTTKTSSVKEKGIQFTLTIPLALVESDANRPSSGDTIKKK